MYSKCVLTGGWLLCISCELRSVANREAQRTFPLISHRWKVTIRSTSIPILHIFRFMFSFFNLLLLSATWEYISIIRSTFLHPSIHYCCGVCSIRPVNSVRRWSHVCVWVEPWAHHFSIFYKPFCREGFVSQAICFYQQSTERQRMNRSSNWREEEEEEKKITSWRWHISICQCQTGRECLRFDST